MMSNGLPKIRVFAAFGYAPGDTIPAGAWTDLSEFLRASNALDVRRGRNHELGRAEVGSIRLTFNNSDARFDPTNENSPYWPDVVPATPVRVESVVDGTTYPLFSGYVDKWPLEYPGKGADSVVQVEAVDIMEALSKRSVYGSYEDLITDDDPLIYWKFDDEEWMRRVSDYSENELHGRTVGFTRTRVEDLLDGGGGAATRFGTVAYAILDDAPSTVRRRGDLTISFWVNLRSPNTSRHLVEVSNDDGSQISWRVSWIGSESRFAFTQNSGGIIEPVYSPVVDGAEVRFVEIVRGSDNSISWRVNGEEIGQSLYYRRASTARNLSLKVCDRTGFGFLGMIDMAHLAVFRKKMSRESTRTRWRHRLDTLPVEKAGDRLQKVVDYTDWDLTTDFDPGVSVLASVPASGSTSDFLQEIAESEAGFLFVDAQGVLVFQDRHYRIRQSNDPVVEFGQGEVGIFDVTPEIDNFWLTNTVRVNDSTFTDDESVARYGEREESLTLPQASENTAESLAWWLINRNAEPNLRFSSLTIRPQKDPSWWDPLLSLELSDRVVVRWTPPGRETLEVACHVEHITHTVTNGYWETVLQLSSADDVKFWRLEDSEKGQIDNPDIVIAP